MGSREKPRSLPYSSPRFKRGNGFNIPDVRLAVERAEDWGPSVERKSRGPWRADRAPGVAPRPGRDQLVGEITPAGFVIVGNDFGLFVCSLASTCCEARKRPSRPLHDLHSG
jgi:hypothetical protein